MKIYNAGTGGAFRIFITDNKTDTFVIDYGTALTETEKHFIREFAPLIGFRDNLKQTLPINSINQYEWYNITDNFLNYLKQQQNSLQDIHGNGLTITDFEKAQKAAEQIRDKINFYNMVEKINSDYLLPERSIGKLENLNHEFPFIVKSVQGKGGKGNIVCYSPQDLAQIQAIFSSELFAAKQENKQYNTSAEVILEKFFPNAPSYNFSFYCDKDGRLSNGQISQQIIDEVFYRGNTYPAHLNAANRQRIIKIGEDICHYINRNGNFMGWIGLDFISVNNRIYVIEANPRVNSVTHAHQLAKNNAFIIKLLKRKNISGIFDKFFFNHKTHRGILPYQIPNNEEILIISIHSSLPKAIQQLETFKQQNQLSDVVQNAVNCYSKSVSYYVAKIK